MNLITVVSSYCDVVGIQSKNRPILIKTTAAGAALALLNLNLYRDNPCSPVSIVNFTAVLGWHTDCFTVYSHTKFNKCFERIYLCAKEHM